MKRHRYGIATLLAALLWMAAPLAGDRPMGIEDTLALRQVGDFHWSADGASVFFIIRDWQKEKNRYITHIYKVAKQGGEMMQMTRGERGESSIELSPDGKYLGFLARRAGGDDSQASGNQIFLLPLEGGEARQVTEEENGVSGFSFSPDGRRLAFTTRDSYPDKKEREKRKKDKNDAVVVDSDFLWTHLWAIGIDGENKNRLTEGDFNASSPVWSPDGKGIVFQTNQVPYQPSPWKHIDDDRSGDLYWISSEGGTAENLTPGPGRASNPRFSPDGKRLSYSGAPNDDNVGEFDLYTLDIASKQSRNLTTEDPNSVQGGGVWSRDGSTLYYSQGRGLHTMLDAIPSGGGASQTVFDAPGISGGFGVSPDGRWLAFAANDPERPGDLWVSRVDGSNTDRITDVNPQITDFALGESRPLKWKSSDGWNIDGVLTLPVGYRAGTRYPLILQIHGGPTGRFTHSFNGRGTQIWAGRGFAILQPNPRGSTGYGTDFAKANQGDWGGKDFHNDDMTGVDQVIAMGIADPDRMVVMGGSYGGFSTFWAVTQTDRFKAAIGHAAISDWYSFYGQTDIPQYLQWGFEGHAWDNPDTFRKWSPIEYAKNVKTPLMITHGEEDHRVAIAQAEQYYTALKKLGVEVEFVRFPREGHGIREPNHVIDLDRRQLEWFDKHLGITREQPEEMPAGGR